MADWPLRGDGQKWMTGSLAGSQSSGLVPVTAGAAHTKGSWATLLTIAQNAAPCSGVLIVLRPTTNTADYCIDLGIGAAGSERVVVPDILISHGTGEQSHSVFLPLGFQTGIRVAMRCQSTTGSAALSGYAALVAAGARPSQPFQRCTSYGITADSTHTQGTSIDPGATANTKGSWTEITSSTTHPIEELVVMVGNQASATRTFEPMLIDIGIGASGSEIVIVPSIPALVGVVPGGKLHPAIPCSIPDGTRIAVRAQADNNDSSRSFDVGLLGLD